MAHAGSAISIRFWIVLSLCFAGLSTVDAEGQQGKPDARGSGRAPGAGASWQPSRHFPRSDGEDDSLIYAPYHVSHASYPSAGEQREEPAEKEPEKAPASPGPMPEAVTEPAPLPPPTTTAAAINLLEGDSAYAARVPMLGRMDQNSRWNIFDNQSAIPRNRMALGYQLAEGTVSGVRLTTRASEAAQPGATIVPPGGGPAMSFDEFVRRQEGITRDIVGIGNQNTLRYAVEWAPFNDFSITFQGQYIDPYDTESPGDDFTNPQVMFKLAFYHNYFTVLSAVFAISPEVERDRAVLIDDETRLYPGLLGYSELTYYTFAQGGFQFGMPTHGDLYTFDWALGIGHWLYRHECLECGCCRPKCSYCSHEPFIQGIVPQFEILGKHIIDDSTVRGPFGLSARPPVDAMGNQAVIMLPGGGMQAFDQAIFIFDEPKHVVDLTFGATILMKHNVDLGLGVSFPITGAEVRRTEFLSYLNFGF